MNDIEGKYAIEQYFHAFFCVLSWNEKSQVELSKYLTYVLKDELLYCDGRLCILEGTNCVNWKLCTISITF
jgi:hypothetical protein